jgi:SAM-dependent methyltransferase
MHDEYEASAEFYDHVTSYRDREDVSFFVEEARAAGGPVLELGCGTGRVLVPTARAGVEIVGLDSSPSMLALCRRRAEAEAPDVGARITLVEGDIRRFDIARTFQLVTLPFRPFQHLLTVEDQLSCLAAIRRHLPPGGRLLLDLFNPSLEMLVNPPREEIFPEPDFDMPDGRRVRRGHRLPACDRFAQVNQVELTYHVTHPDGRTERLVHAFPFRYLFRFEAEHLLVRAGFEIEAVYADYDRTPYGSRYPGDLIFDARRR